MMRTALILALATAVCVSGAADAKKRDPLADPAFKVSYPAADEDTPPTANGSIFQADAGYSPLINGDRAASVGDVLTIVLVENTNATKSSSSNTTKAGSIGVSPPTTGLLSKLFSSSDVAASGSHNFKGAGDASQSNALSGSISVTVAKVYRNGSMLVRGQKQLTLNRGDEFVQISGLVRQADIGPDNSVLSTRVADARIAYTGKGDVARASTQGWLSHFFSIISPF